VNSYLFTLNTVGTCIDQLFKYTTVCIAITKLMQFKIKLGKSAIAGIILNLYNNMTSLVVSKTTV